jgi:23S rRNA pseudouridine1911/1915/1917 synthase
MCKDLSGIGGEMRPGIVHRLDKETSGIMVVAKNDRAHKSLSEQFKSRETKKEYVAVVSGEMKKSSGVFSSPIGRSSSNRVKMTSFSKAGRDAETRWEVVERLRGATLVSVWPKTGRTHQIRVHFSENGFPVLADKVYGGKKSRLGNFGVAGTLIKRHALHAKSLGLTHPVTGKRIEFSAKIPEDMVSVINFLRRRDG